MRRAATIVLGCLAVLLALPPSMAGAQDASTTTEKTGWWNRYVGPAENGGPGLPVPPPSTVPPNAIAVGATNGTADKVAAIGFAVDVPDDLRLTELALVLTEATEPGANVRADSAKVFACPVTAPWSEARNGRWIDRPTAECDLGVVAGERSAAGSWFFDLTDLGALWLDDDSPLEQNGVALFVDAAQSANTQVSFRDDTAGGVFLSLETERAPAEQADAPAPQPAPEPRPTVFSAPPFDPGPVDVPPPAAVSTPEPEPAVLMTRPATSQGELREPNVLGNLPWGVALLVPLVLGTAALLSYSLGPAGEPDTASSRRGAVSRALARRRTRA